MNATWRGYNLYDLTPSLFCIGLKQIPVFKGSEKALVGQVIQAAHYHGNDGFGDNPDPEAPGIELLQPDFAVTSF